LFWGASRRHVLSVNVQIDARATGKLVCNPVNAVDQILKIDDLDTAVHQIVHQGVDIAIRVHVDDAAGIPGRLYQTLIARLDEPAKQLRGDHGPGLHAQILRIDFREAAALEQLREVLRGEPVDLVLSDMAPNMSGQDSTDQARAMYLAELALDFVDEVLRPSGAFLTKIFQGVGFDEYLRGVRARFDRVASRKPDASRARSREIYLLGQGFRG